MKPLISVVMLTWNDEKIIENTLNSLISDSTSSRIPIEIIIIDNGSKDYTLDIIERNFSEKCIIVPFGKNTGTTFSRNVGIRMSKGDYILILDSDVELRRGTLLALIESVEKLPTNKENIGIIHPKLIYPDGILQESARKFPTLFTKIYRLFAIEKMRNLDESIREVLKGEICKVDYAISAAWFIPRHTFKKVGLLNERIFYSPEDLDYCIRCWLSGLEVWYYPLIEVVHNCRRITNKNPFSILAFSHINGLFKLWCKYKLFFSRKKFYRKTNMKINKRG